MDNTNTLKSPIADLSLQEQPALDRSQQSSTGGPFRWGDSASVT